MNHGEMKRVGFVHEVVASGFRGEEGIRCATFFGGVGLICFEHLQLKRMIDRFQHPLRLAG